MSANIYNSATKQLTKFAGNADTNVVTVTTPTPVSTNAHVDSLSVVKTGRIIQVVFSIDSVEDTNTSWESIVILPIPKVAFTTNMDSDVLVRVDENGYLKIKNVVAGESYYVSFMYLAK